MAKFIDVRDYKAAETILVQAIEANPLISSAMAVVGVVCSVAGAKAVAIAFGMVLHLRRVHNLVAVLSAIYFTLAILPWTALFLTN